MSLLTTSDVKKEIACQVSQTTETLQIISAFCKQSALKYIDENINSQLKEKKLMVRFLLSDIIQHSTDFSIIEYCRNNGWQLFVRFDLHAKTYIFDKKRCIIGSANLTSKGFGLNSMSNFELSCLADVDNDDLNKINKLFDNAILINDYIYDKMKTDYNNVINQKSISQKNIRWSSKIEKMFTPIIDVLFSYDFPNAPYPDFNNVHCFEFLDINYIPSIEELKVLFRWSKPFLWLYNTINETPDKTMFFGSVTSVLHSFIISDPKPYRRDVKTMLSYLLNWISFLKMDNVFIDIPNHSQRIRII